MRILFFYQYFGTPKGSWSTRIYELTRRWVSEGCSVEVVTAPYEKSDIKAVGLISKTTIEGINVTVINSPDNNRISKWFRAFNAIKFAIIASYFSATRKYDIVIASSGPITIGIPMLFAKIFRKKKTVFEVRDLWPLGAIELGFIKGYFQTRISFLFESFIYRMADLIVTCSPGQQRDIVDRFPTLKPIVISNASDNGLFTSFEHTELPKQYQNFCLLTHIGSLGKIHNIYYWVNLAEDFYKKYSLPVKFLFIGEGADKADLEELVKNKNLEHVHFLGIMPKYDLLPWLLGSYATLFATTDNYVQDTCSPNKIFDSFAAGVPIIQTSKGWIKDLVEQKNCGINLDINNTKYSADLLHQYLLDVSKRNIQAKNAKELANTIFNRDVLAAKYLEELKKLAQIN